MCLGILTSPRHMSNSEAFQEAWNRSQTVELRPEKVMFCGVMKGDMFVPQGIWPSQMFKESTDTMTNHLRQLLHTFTNYCPHHRSTIFNASLFLQYSSIFIL